MDISQNAGKFRVLLVDDDSDIRAVVRRGIEAEGAELLEAADGATALTIHARAPVDITVLDLGLPDMHGLELLAALRLREPTVHVIILTGAGAEEDRVRGLLSGADDYVVKPFSVPELIARITSAMRRRAPREPTVIEIEGLRMDLASRSVAVDGVAVELTRREFDLLHLLIANPKRVFSRDEILRLAWDSSAKWQSAATITEHIRRIRLKIESDARQPRRIVTVRGTGYQFGTTTVASQSRLPELGDDITGDATALVVGTAIVRANCAAVEIVGARAFRSRRARRVRVRSAAVSRRLDSAA